MLKIWTCWQQFKAFMHLSDVDREIVFYSEGHAYWVHFEPIIMALLQQFGRRITYLTSEEKDPVLSKNISGMRAFWIGEGFVRTMAFKALKAKICVLTMPDLQSFYLKRSMHPVHYVYIFHSLVSTHRIYRPGAFDHYDSIFCSGPHHIEEIRKNEQINNLHAKQLFEHGYGRLDAIITNNEQRKYNNYTSNRKILIAPSWGKDNLLQSVGEQLIALLLKNHFEVVLRPHPQTVRHDKPLLNSLLKIFEKHAGFSYETDMTTQQSLFESSIMISDWSGAALDFALGLEKPVLFINVPAKTHNPYYEKLQLPTLEEKIRSQIGEILEPQDIDQAPALLNKMLSNQSIHHEKILLARKQWVFHVQRSGLHGAEILDRLATELNSEQKEALVTIS